VRIPEGFIFRTGQDMEPLWLYVAFQPGKSIVLQKVTVYTTSLINICEKQSKNIEE